MPGLELIGPEELKEVMEVMETGVLMRYGFDNERKGVFKVRQFEEEFARYCGAGYALGVTSGSSALKIALIALDVGPGDEVLVPAFTFLATWESVLEVGAIPVMVDIDESLNMDPADMERKISPSTRRRFRCTCAVQAPGSTGSSKWPAGITFSSWRTTPRAAGARSRGKSWAPSETWGYSALITTKP